MKHKIIMFLPYASTSGYGYRSYDLLRSIIQLKENDWNYKIVSMRFGNSPQRELDSSDPIDQKILANTITQEQAFQQGMFDLCIFSTVPSELKEIRIAKYSINFSAIVESTLAPADIILGCNNINLTVCSSNHGANVLKSTVYDQRDPQGNVIGQLKLTNPTEVLFEGIDTTKFDRKNKQEFNLDIPESFTFLISGMWLPGAFSGPHSHDRKHFGTMIKTFLETFKNTSNKPALILKVNSGNYSNIDQDYTKDRIDEIRSTVQGDLPNIYLIHGLLSENELIGLYQHDKVKCLLAASAEGWGRGPVEYMCATSKPVIGTMYGGMGDYLKPEYTLTVPGTLQPVHKSAANQFLLEESQIYYPDIKQLSAAMLTVFNNYKEIEEKAKRQAHYIRTSFSLDRMTERLDEILKKHVPEFPKVMQIKLPKLSEMKLPTLNKKD